MLTDTKDHRKKYKETILKTMTTHQFFKAVTDILNGNAIYQRIDGTILDLKNE